jgi:LysR family cys regulon transcriptional activator
MNLHQLRFVREAVRQNFNLTEAAKAYLLRNQVFQGNYRVGRRVGVDIFTRHGKRIRGLTEPGKGGVEIGRTNHARD